MTKYEMENWNNFDFSVEHVGYITFGAVKMKMNIFSTVCIIGCILLFLTFIIIISPRTLVPPSNQTALPNPAAVYCEGLGYQYKIITSDDGGQRGICKLSYGIECDAWDFFTGKCGKEYTYCEKTGGKIVTTNVGCRFSSECAVCILPNGTECYEWDYFKGECP